MGIVIMLFVLVGGSIAFSAWYKYKSHTASQSVGKHNDLDDGSSERKCLACGYEGEMKTWIANYKAPKFYFVLGFICGYIPGLIFLALYWGKYKCPSCGAVGKSQQMIDGQ
jgi:predicted RNA-binding Zn-ribbon protein involved in translation (DUF1610 family)